jgi:CO/xanthine dehydrogenase FAD-binding subunit
MDEDTVSDAAIVVGGVTTTPTRATAAQDALVGQAPTEDAIAAAADHVAGAIRDPIGDLYASGEYRTHLAGVLAKRALSRAAALAGS